MPFSKNGQFFRENGYLVVEHVVDGHLLEDLRRESEALADADPDKPRRVWHERVLFRRKAFRDLLDAPRLIETARELMGADVQLLAMDLLLIRAGQGGIGWHRDVNFVCDKTLSMNTGIYLYDMDDAMGPLRVRPGSHRWESHPPNADPLPGELRVLCPAGTAVFFDAALWHTGDVNRSARNRLAVFPYFGRYWVKRMDNYFTQPLPAELLLTKDPMKRQLLGLDLRPGIASYHGDSEAYNRDRGEAGLDFPNE